MAAIISPTDDRDIMPAVTQVRPGPIIARSGYYSQSDFKIPEKRDGKLWLKNAWRSKTYGLELFEGIRPSFRDLAKRAYHFTGGDIGKKKFYNGFYLIF